MPKKKSPLEPRVRRKRAYELPNLINVNTPPDPIRQIENEAIRDLSNEYRQLRIEEMIAKKKKQLTASGSPSNIQAQRENLEYFKTVMELSKMNQPKEGPDRTLDYLKFFHTVTQNQGAPANFFGQYIKGRELGIFGQPSTGNSNTSDVEIEKLRGERMLSGKKIDLELHKMKLEQENGREKMGILAQILSPFVAFSGAQMADQMKRTGQNMAANMRNPGKPNAYQDFLQETGIVSPGALSGDTAKLQFECSCGFSDALLVPMPVPASVSCPNCGQQLSTGPPQISDAEVSTQWQRK